MKKETISKNLFGVDIEGPAVEIAKLRLWLSLIENLEIEDTTHIETLPNIEYNLLVGNSLIGWLNESITQVSLVNPMTDEVKAIFKDLIAFTTNESKDIQRAKELLETNFLKDYIEALYILNNIYKNSHGTKAQRLKEIVETVRNEIYNSITESLLIYYNGEPKTKKKSNELVFTKKELDKRKPFHWAVDFGHILKDGGFDIIIGNPPFIRQENIPEPKKLLNYLYPGVYSGNADYSVYFVKRSLDLLKKEGYHSFIITNKWLTRAYGKSLKRYLKDNFEIQQIIDFGDKTPFKGVTNYVLIYVIKNVRAKTDHKLFYCLMKSEDIETIQEVGYYVLQDAIGEEWTFLILSDNEIKEKMKKMGKPLSQWKFDIFSGIKTGLNKAFIIDSETRGKIIQEDSKSMEHIKPLVSGKEIGRYYYDWKNLWLLYIPWHFEIELYPSILNYLSKFKDKLENRNKEEIGIRYEWYELQRYAPGYIDEFKKPKIMWQWTSKEPSFVWDNNEIYSPNNVFIMTNTSKYILALLNSRLLTWYFENILPKVRGNTLIFAKEYIEPVPLIELEDTQMENIGILTEYLMFLKSSKKIRLEMKEDVEFLDTNILDSIIYEAYFKEKFIEDSIYGENKLLSELVLTFTKDIKFDRWSELNWKKQLEGSLSRDEEEEIKKLEKENLQTIVSFIDSIKQENIIELIEKIKTHPWIKIVERR